MLYLEALFAGADGFGRDPRSMRQSQLMFGGYQLPTSNFSTC